MEMSEFLKDEVEEVETEVESEDIDVQKAVVESLAADKVEQEEIIKQLRKDNNSLQSEIASLREKVDKLSAELKKTGDILAANSETAESNKISLLDRNPDMNDRFTGETRDHVIEVIRAAREQAEKDGQIRKAQVLESVLIINEPEGTLDRKRNELKKLFTENSNILSGPVIEELNNLGISCKNGEEYLLPAEIIKRVY